jgi:hypothetical protein
VTLDELLPSYDFRERHSTRVSAPPAAALAAVTAVTLQEMPAVGPLFALRGIRAARDRPLVAELVGLGFDRLVDAEDELVLGYVGRPWRPTGGRRVRPASPHEWAAFAEPGYAKAALSFRAVDGRLETETRVHLTDAASRRRFALYWTLIRPWSGLIRRSWLRAARRRAGLFDAPF